jgi:hypothetical protein
MGEVFFDVSFTTYYVSGSDQAEFNRSKYFFLSWCGKQSQLKAAVWAPGGLWATQYSATVKCDNGVSCDNGSHHHGAFVGTEEELRETSPRVPWEPGEEFKTKNPTLLIEWKYDVVKCGKVAITFLDMTTLDWSIFGRTHYFAKCTVSKS